MQARTIGIAVMIAAGLAALIGSGSSKPGGGGGGHKTSGPRGGSAANDVTIVSCTTTNGQPTAKVQIVNHSSKASGYIVTITFDSSDGKIHYRSSLTSVNNVGSGRSVVRNVAVVKSGSGKFTCKVSDVTRWAS